QGETFSVMVTGTPFDVVIALVEEIRSAPGYDDADYIASATIYNFTPDELEQTNAWIVRLDSRTAPSAAAAAFGPPSNAVNVGILLLAAPTSIPFAYVRKHLGTFEQAA